MDSLVYYLLPILFVIIVSIWYLFTHDTKVPNLHKKCVLITGCDTGFGRQLAITLDVLGLRVFAGCLTDKGQQELQDKCSDRLQTVQMDVTNSQDIQKCLERVENFLETSDDTVLLAIVNNAGIDISGFFDWSSLQNIKKVFDVNLWGVLEVTKTFLPLLKKSRGRIVNVASAAGKVAVLGAGAYSASKFAIQCYCDVLRNELKPFGVSVHIIDPGFFKTNLTDQARKEKELRNVWDSLSQETRDEYGEHFIEEVVVKARDLLLHCQDMSPVIQAMEHAVTSSRPRLRYIVGWDHKLMWRWLAFLPSWVQDMVFKLISPLPKIAAKL